MDPLAVPPDDVELGTTSYLQWTPVVAGAIAAAATSFVLMTFGTAIGLSVSSASPTWRDTSAFLALLSGVWILVVAVGSFALGGYLAGRMRPAWPVRSDDEIEFRDGVHGLVVWGLAVMIGAILAIAAANVAATASGRSPGSARPSPASASEQFLALELDRLFRSDRRPAEGADAESRAEAARILATGLGHTDIAPDDRAYLVRLVAARTGLSPADAERRVNDVIAQAKQAATRARTSSVILAFMIGAAVAAGAAAAWFAACMGGRHRDTGRLPSMIVVRRVAVLRR